MGDGEIGYDIIEDYDDDSGCHECGQHIDENFVWDGECLSCEQRMTDYDIDQYEEEVPSGDTQ